MIDDRNIDVYRVGVLWALHMDWRALTITHRRPTYVWRDIRYLAARIRRREWRPIRMHFNGWMAEHRYAGTRAGHGWTRRRALADLRRHLDEQELTTP